MLPYIVRRVLIAVPLLGVVLFVSFMLLYALPGDPVDALLGTKWSQEEADRIRAAEGLDDPILVQFGRYLRDVVWHFDLGTNQRKKPVAEELATRLPATIELGLAALILATIVGVSMGMLSALRPRGWRDMAILIGSLAGVSMPIFWLALLVLRTFRKGGWLMDAAATEGYGLLHTLHGWLVSMTSVVGFEGMPLGGRLSEASKAAIQQQALHAEHVLGDPLNLTGFHLIDSIFVFRDWGMFTDALSHLTLPACVLATVPAAFITRITRTAVGEQLSQDYIRTARAKGVAPGRIILRHALSNAAIPIVTSIGTQLGRLLGGAVLTETIFGWPGMGTYIVDAILKGDVRPLQAGVLVIAAGFVVINLIVDVSYAFLDPRVRLEGGRA